MFEIPHVGRSAWTARLLAVLLPCLLARPVPAQEKDDPAITKFREQLADKRTDREKLRLEVLSFLRRNAGTPAGVQAARVLGRLPSPPDHLDAKLIPDIERFDWQPKELVAVLGEHRGRQGNVVNAVACSRDGKRIASIGNDGSLRIWSTANLRQEARVGVSGAGMCLAFSRDSKYLAAGGAYGGLYVWDVSKKDPVLTGSFSIGTTPVYSVDISPDSKVLAAGVYDGFIHLFALGEGKPKVLPQLSGHKTPVRAVRFAPGGKYLATASTDGSIRFWELGKDVDKDGGKEVGQVEGQPKGVLAMEFSPGGGTLAVASNDGLVILYTVVLPRASRRTQFKAHAGLLSLCWSPKGHTLATCGSEGTARLWDPARLQRPWAVVEGHYGAVNGVMYLPGTDRPGTNGLVTGGADWTVRVWNVTGARPAERFPFRGNWCGHWSLAYNVRFAPDAKTVASGGEDLSARVWDMTRPKPVQIRQFPCDAAVYTLALGSDGKTLATAGASTTMTLWDYASGHKLRSFKEHPTYIYQLAYTPDCTRLLASSGTALLLWNANNAREISRFVQHEQRINTFSLSGDGRYALTGTGYYQYDKDGKIVMKGSEYQYVDCSLRLFDLQAIEMVQEVKKLPYPVSNVSYTPDGKQAACSLWRGNTHLWDVSPRGLKDKGELATTAPWAHIHVFSPDGERLATMGNNYQFILYDMAKKKVLKQWSFAEYISGVTFSPDGRYLAFGLYTGPVYILRLEEPPAGSSR
ncbi:MAG: WD40 repeat domain-containing protein [Planctomycetes bacterium]|nr:WD40 repeat domain-containing protein [Planctomycetota bacterium]